MTSRWKAGPASACAGTCMWGNVGMRGHACRTSNIRTNFYYDSNRCSVMIMCKRRAQGAHLRQITQHFLNSGYSLRFRQSDLLTMFKDWQPFAFQTHFGFSKSPQRSFRGNFNLLFLYTPMLHTLQSCRTAFLRKSICTLALGHLNFAASSV